MSRYLRTLNLSGVEYFYYDICEFAKLHNLNIDSMPYSTKILLENLLRNIDGVNILESDVINFCLTSSKDLEISFMPARVLMQDFTGVPAVVDLAAMRDEMVRLGKDPAKINPFVQADLVIDHSVQVDSYASNISEKTNTDMEFERNKERYEFLKWGQSVFQNFRVISPGNGICHQINIEYLTTCVRISSAEGKNILHPDTVVGTDSHTTMVNGLGVLGWGVGGIEAEAVMLNQPISMTKPEVVGCKLTGKLSAGVTAMDLVLTLTNLLRMKKVVGKFVEFFGAGIMNLSLPDRATVANMAPEYGATCGIFPIDDVLLNYLQVTGKSKSDLDMVRMYYSAQNMWFNPDLTANYDDILELDLASVQASVAGPKRPQDRLNLSDISANYQENFPIKSQNFSKLSDGSVVIAAITSCTNTSNPYALVGAGLLAKKACEMGLKSQYFVKTSLAPGSKVVTEYMEKSGLQLYLDKLGFNVVGYGCTTCIGNSGALKPEFEEEITGKNYTVAAVISGNRNFEGRVHPLVKANYLASPALVVAYAIAGNVSINIEKDPIGTGNNGENIYLKDIWPSRDEIEKVVNSVVNAEIFSSVYANILGGNEQWRGISTTNSPIYNWPKSTYIENPPYFTDCVREITDIKNAKILAVFGDSITTDHISPAGNISLTSAAGRYLISLGVPKADFNSYGARRGSHSVMMRGTFANIRIKNELLGGVEGGMAKMQSGEIASIYDAAMECKSMNIPAVVVAGKEYGTGSSRDWAAKGTKLLGIQAVIAESFERIHRSNLVGMGVLPLEFTNGDNRANLDILGCESIDIDGISASIAPKSLLKAKLRYKNGTEKVINLLCRLDTARECEYYISGGIFHYVIKKI